MRKRALWGAALALGLIAYAPASNITFLPRFTADTYAFLPLFWLVFAGACAIEGALGRAGEEARSKARLYILTSASVLVVVLAGSSYLQAMRWRSDLAMWGPMVERETPTHQPYYMYGSALWSVGDYAKAAEVFESHWEELFSFGRLPLAFPRSLYEIGRVADAHSAARAIWYSPLNLDIAAACDVLDYSTAHGPPEPKSYEACVAAPTLDTARLAEVASRLPSDQAMSLRIAHTR